MLNDADITKISRELDDVFTMLVARYQITNLSLAAIANARLLKASALIGEEEDYKKLLLHITDVDLTLPINTSKH